MKTLILFFVALVSLTAAAQTKPVAFRSHSGNMKYFASEKDPDNLGWGGVPLNREFMFIDTTALVVDTTTLYPYCNDPSVSKDSLQTNFPLYTATMTDSTTTKPLDTLAKPKEKMISRSDVKKNETIPVTGTDPGNGNPNGSYGMGFIVLLTGSLILIGSMIWITQRKKIVSR